MDTPCDFPEKVLILNYFKLHLIIFKVGANSAQLDALGFYFSKGEIT